MFPGRVRAISAAIAVAAVEGVAEDQDPTADRVDKETAVAGRPVVRRRHPTFRSLAIC
jgi:hypothetical protein